MNEIAISVRNLSKDFRRVTLGFALAALFLIVGIVYAHNLEEETFNRGMNYTSKGMYDEAIEEFTKAIEKNPKNAYAYYNRGLTYHKKGKLDKAILDYDKAIEINPKEAEIYYNRGIAYYYKDYLSQAISDWSKAVEISPDSAAIYQKRAFAYFKKEEYDKSWQDVHKVEELGYRVEDKFLEDLKKFSGRVK